MRSMNKSGGDEGPAVLQLHKWRQSEVDFLRNLSEFRQGYISPSRELLLLLSKHCEALLLPVVKEKPRTSSDTANVSCQGLEDVDCAPSRLAKVSGSAEVPELTEASSGTSVKVDADLAKDFTRETGFLGSHGCGFISDVHSLAWANCENASSEHEDTPFRDILFVSGKSGVTVHAFCKPHRTRKVKKSMEGHENSQGMWVDWGPSLDDPGNATSVLHYDGSKSSYSKSRTIEEVDCRKCNHVQDPVNDSPDLRASKRWLSTFLVKLQSENSDGHLFTRFPESSLLPSSAEVISFNIFGDDSLLLEFISKGFPVVHDRGSDHMSIDMRYKCFRVFSSSSFSIMGFALELIDFVHINESDVCERKSGTVIAMVNVVSCGLRWVSSVKLDEGKDTTEWTDFKLSSAFLFCLKKSGLISVYSAMSGNLIASIDLFLLCGFQHRLGLPKEEVATDKYNGRVPENHVVSCREVHDFTGTGRFKSLLTFSDVSLLGIVDELGTVYVIRIDDHIQGNHNSFGKLFSDYQWFGCGILAPWGVASSEIGCQSASKLRINCKSFSSRVYTEIVKRSSFLRSSPKISDFSGAELSLNVVREIFIPNDQYSEDDVVCFSPFGVTRLMRRYIAQEHKKFKLSHSSLFVERALNDDQVSSLQGWETSTKEAVGCVFLGSLYLVTAVGLSVVLPAISNSSSFFPVEAIGYRFSTPSSVTRQEVSNHLEIERSKKPWSPWKVEVLDRVLLFESPEEADQLCLENGWELSLSRIRRLQLALHYLKFEEIENSLEMLAVIHLAEEGILRVIFAAAYLISRKVNNDNEVSAASRLLTLGTSFAIKIVRKYGLLHHKRNMLNQNLEDVQSFPVLLPNVMYGDGSESLRRMSDMACYLEIIRDLQLRLTVKYRRLGRGLVDGPKLLRANDADLLEDDSKNSIESTEPSSLGAKTHDSLDPEPANVEVMALIPVNKTNTEASVVSGGSSLRKRILPVENPKDMITRWEVGDLDIKNIVSDALLSGRLPLAVLKLHLLRSQDVISKKETDDTFNEVRDVGRAIAYDFFLKGETSLAVATLQKLGEDVETSLKQLLFGTLRRSLRRQISEVMKTYGSLGSREWKILENISLIERVYPCSSFWNTFSSRWNDLKDGASSIDLEGIKLRLLHPLHNNLQISCGDIDGAVLGPWTRIIGHPVSPEVDNDSSHASYWTAAAIWSDAWDHLIINRVVLDQPFVMGVNILWESQVEYYMGHNDWLQVSMLLEVIPLYALSTGTLSVRLDSLPPPTIVEYAQDISECDNYTCSLDDLDAVCLTIPKIKIFRFPINDMCSIWLRMLMEQQLAKKFIFLRDYWVGTAEIVPLLARSGFLLDIHDTSSLEESTESSTDLVLSVIDAETHPDTVLALHKCFVQFCAQYNLVNLLDIYLDHHKLAVDQDSLSLVQDAVGDNLWAKWLLFQRVKGKEYEASFCNARAVVLHNFLPGNSMGELDVDDMMQTVDDIAEGAGEMAALATLMYAPIPIQECLSSGSINRQFSSGQCTLENLRPALQCFPTLWRTLLAACFGQDPTCPMFSSKPKVTGYSDLMDYLYWRESIFFSSACDTSLLQMLPGWFSKAVRRLVQLYVQGPLGWQSVADFRMGEYFWSRDLDSLVDSGDHSEISAISWETAIQKHIEEELCASASEDTGLGLEHHLHRGRALAAFNHLLALRVERWNKDKRGSSGTSAPAQTNVQSDVHVLLSPITQDEESLLSEVVPLAIVHFKDSVLVASCALLLELCGLSASILQIDIAALRRISSFYESDEHKKPTIQLPPKGSALHTKSREGDIAESLARALADDYLRNSYSNSEKQRDPKNSGTAKFPSRALIMVLQHLERASLPAFADGMTCGSWLMTGSGDGAELRSQQKAASQKWNLVTVFCQLHQMPLSTKYLACLARDNDWVGFLSEAQVGGFPIETVIDVASKEFNDPRLKGHLLTVLKSMQSRKQVGSAANSDATTLQFEAPVTSENLYGSVELFGIIAECEKLENPGEALLLKAKNLSWSILAMVAACFPDVSPLSCLAVWLEITAARETSAIKVNDVATQIASNVGAAVEATNVLPATARAITFHYNRRTPKRRRLMEPALGSSAPSNAFDASSTSGSLKFEEDIAEEERENGTDKDLSSSDEVVDSLSRMVAVLCEQQLFLPLLRAFEIFLPSCSLLPFIRALQAFAQMRLSEASAHLGSFSVRIKEEQLHAQTNIMKEGPTTNLWTRSTSVKAADAMLLTCPSPYEKRCLLQLLASTDFGGDGSISTYYQRLYWKINLAEPSLRKDDGLHLGNETLNDDSLLTALIRNGYWEQARNWARQLEASGGSWKSIVHHVTEMQAESMVAEWKEFLWDVPEERVALWDHCHTLFIRYSFPASQAGLFFLKHAEAVEKDLPARELHQLLLLSLQWLSGTITQSSQACPLNILREIETKVWLLAVESEAQVKGDGEPIMSALGREPGTGKCSNIVDHTADVISKIDTHMNSLRVRTAERSDIRENNQAPLKNSQILVDSNVSATTAGNTKMKRRQKGFVSSRKPVIDVLDKASESEGISMRDDSHLVDDNGKFEAILSRCEERVGSAGLERAVLSLMEFGQISAARQLQYKLSPGQTPSEFVILDAALKLASMSAPNSKVAVPLLDDEVRSVLNSCNLLAEYSQIDPLEVLEGLSAILKEGRGRGLCKRIISVVKAANVLGLSFSEAFNKQPIELLQLLTLKAQESLEEANLLVATHPMPPSSIAQVLAESFQKGLLAAHRGGYMDSQKEEGPAPLLWRFSDFLKWAELCPSESEIGHALMKSVITGQEIPHACEVELLILSHHFYKSSACLDGVDVLVALAATRVEAYVSEGDFTCLARLITGVGNFHALNFILGILIENGQLDLLLQKFSAAADANAGTAEAVRGFRMAVLTSLQQFNPEDLDAFALVYNHFDMKHETAALLESRAEQSSQQWFLRYDRDQTDDLLESMRYFIEAAEVHSSIDAGNKTRKACAQASLVSLQIRMPDLQWLNLSETNARRALVEQSRFQEALVVAEAYGLNQPSEWALVLWNQMLKPELTEQFVAEFVAVLPLQPSMLIELARFYRAEVAARGDQSQFSVWLTGGGLPAEWAKYLGRSFRCLLRRTRDLRLQLQLATLATGFSDVIDSCNKALDKVPDNAGPLVLRKGHGGAYLPLM
ncbi:OLC1v1008939C1 [Oldenlandia corymbosa var. corymbosa]|uniref:OLC1v1008939C1 n=1 Tax=Oldenlandia corymbosa var. corymbosa TaxID=529605 RepID=A0AAV1DMS9_OLDCO|nr:OLC1v1008939C1 [Oldenlandia corymbosa var. corymbosa]